MLFVILQFSWKTGCMVEGLGGKDILLAVPDSNNKHYEDAFFNTVFAPIANPT
jgi:hypothetical protein